MTTAAFVSILITGCDPEKVKRVSKSKKLLTFPFTLSAKPKEAWVDVFEAAWESARKKSTRRKTRARIRKGEILLDCSLSDVKPLLVEVKECVDVANKSYAVELQEQGDKDAKRKQKEEEDRQALLASVQQALEGIEFSSGSTDAALAKPAKAPSAG